ncbi:MAG: ABC transporter permease [Dehalococcoidia bacterium]|nr:ABC transporter permease [Dehalococcoidia bacterium]HJN88505.1 ABC transporter permease [Dehalococcoidia bacterium]
MTNKTAALEHRPSRVAAVWRHPLIQAFLSDKVTLISGTFITLVVLASIFAPIVAPHDPDDGQLPLRHLEPFSSGIATDRSVSPPVREERFFLLGTDHLGRDMASRLIYGGRISLTVGILGVLVSGIIGLVLGMLAGYYRGLVDDIIMRAVDIFMSVPLLLLALLVIFILGASFWNIILVFALGRWMLYCRVCRGVVMSLREQAFVEAARSIGCTDLRIVLRHVLPNLITPLMTIAALDVPRIILTESTLSFLGFGIQPPESSWGTMLSRGREYLTTAWWVVVLPGTAIFVTALSFNLFGVWLRAVSDPLQRWRWLKRTEESKQAGIGS